MFKCCVCHGKASRRTSQEEDEDESEREMDEEDEEDDESSSSSEEEGEESDDEDEEEKEIEAELAKKFKCQDPNIPLTGADAVTVRSSLKEENEAVKDKGEEIVVEVNGDVKGLREKINEKSVDKEAIREDVVEILNCAVKIVQEIRRGERERLEKIKEEAAEETIEESIPAHITPAAPVAAPVTPEAPPAAAGVIVDKEIDRGEEKKPELEKVESTETEEDVVTVIEDEEEEGEYEIVEEIKKDGTGLEKSKTDQIEEMIIEELINELNEEADNVQELKEIIETTTNGSQSQLFQTSNENIVTETHPNESSNSPVMQEKKEKTEEKEEVVVEEEEPQPPPPPFCEVEIIEEIKKTELYKIENNLRENVCVTEQEIIEVNVKQGVCPTEGEAVEETIPDSINGDLLNIPPPVTPPPEEVYSDRLDENNAELDFPTPPPIDFDIAETAQEEEEQQQQPPPPPKRDFNEAAFRGPPVPPWDESPEPQEERQDSTQVEDVIMPVLNNRPVERRQLDDLILPVLNRQDSKPSSPGSKSLPSPPSPASDCGNETEADSKSSSDEQSTKIMPCGSKTAYIERTIDDGPDEEGDDSVFEPAALAKDPEIIIKDIPPRPVPPVPRWLSQEEDEPENTGSEGFGGMQEPPATPVARDELALRRHRFFSDLLQAARNTAEHRVSFDPLGPMVHPGCEHDDREEHLEELVNRLENVTKRLEQVSAHPLQATLPPPVQTQEIAVQTKSPSPERSLSLTEELHPEESSQSSSSSRESTVSVPSVVEVPAKSMSVTGYQDLLAGPVQDYIQLSKKIGGDVASHCQLVEKAFQIQLQFLQTVASRPAPTNQSEQVSLLGPTSTQIQKIQEFRESHRGSPFFNHLSAISESVPALGWVAVAPTPAPYVKEMNDAGQFYTNRVLKDWKEKDKTHVEWCKAWVKTLSDLQQFVRQHHTTGLVWAKTGSLPAGGVPPPPPPCMMPMADPAPVLNDDRSALFAEINQGENITKNLKKVTSDMQTHKNTNLRTGPAPFKAPVVSNNSGSPVKTTLPANAPIDKPPVFTRDGKKWLVEYHKGNKNLLIDQVEMNNVVYMFRCQDSNLVIKGKINSVVLDSCRKCAVVVDSVVASIEFVNCQSVQMQVLGKVPTVSIDKTDGCQMYLNKDTLDVALITSKSSEMNVMVPVGNGDYTEYPVPEQFKTVITKNGLSTVAVDSLG